MDKLWTPSAARIEQANVTAFARDVAHVDGADASGYPSLWRWSVVEKEKFWRGLWDFGGVIGMPGAQVLADPDRMPGARWFPDARFNFAQNLLERKAPDDRSDALVFRGEDKANRRMSHAELQATVSRFAQALKALGIAA